MPRRKYEYLTPDQAADLLGWVGPWRGKRLLRVMLAKERLRGREIMGRAGGKGFGIRYQLTEPMLRRYCSELFMTTQDELVAEVRRHLGAIDGRVEAIVDERTAPGFEELRIADQLLSKELARLSKHTNSIDQRVATLESERKRTKADTKPRSR